MDFYEMHGLPEAYGLRETGFYMAGMNWFADWGMFLPWYIFKLGRFDWGAWLGAKLLVWSTEKFTKPPHEVVLKLEAAGCLNGQPAQLELYARHPDGYMFTAIPVAACILQYLDGSICKPGLWIMGQAVEPLRLMRDMERMGADIEERLVHPGEPVPQ
jgi:saccharopine dehydrogenase (NAD+, L-lysine-forming)